MAIGLLLGLFSNLIFAGGALLSLMIRSTAEGFGGPCQAGLTDIGPVISSVLVFAGLVLTTAGRSLGLAQRLGPSLGRWGFLASGRADAPGAYDDRATAWATSRRQPPLLSDFSETAQRAPRQRA